MMKKKICLLGSLAVGKTSLIQRYVNSIFSDQYLTSIGVKISKKEVWVNDQQMDLMLWDLEGQDDYSIVNTNYIRGSSGLLFVVDGCRGETLSVALMLRNSALKMLGPDIPHLILVNKEDMIDVWEVTGKVLESLSNSGLMVLKTSAKTGLNVDEAFHSLAAQMMDQSNETSE